MINTIIVSDKSFKDLVSGDFREKVALSDLVICGGNIIKSRYNPDDYIGLDIVENDEEITITIKKHMDGMMITKLDLIKQLRSLTSDMVIPSLRKSDFRWLQRNLASRNKSHPNFEVAKKIIRLILREENRNEI